jgi:AAA+ ATPase superfamily predicted ATPase
MNFIGRTRELELLQGEYRRKHPSLVVVYGRRRVGKSTLLLRSLQQAGLPSIYYQASRLTDFDNLKLLKQALTTQLELSPTQLSLLAGLSDWTALLAFWQELAQQSPQLSGLTIVLDEFPYLCEANPALPSLLQAAWDRVRAANTLINLVLCGSSIAFMEELLAERNPLRGRQTVELNLQPLTYREVAQALPHYTPEERLLAYGLWGGLPYSLSLLDPEAPLMENLVEVTLRSGAPLYDEPNLLLQAELHNPPRYASILHAIAEGCHDYGEIIGRVRDFKDRGQLAPYVRKLEELRLVEVARPLNASPKERNNRYFLADPFLMFWYRFVLPNRSALEAGHHQAVLRQAIQPHLSDYMGPVFGRICREYLRRYGQEQLGQPARSVGQIWARDYDLDVVGELLSGEVVFGECKWWDEPVGINVLDKLEHNVRRTNFGDRQTARLLLFSRKGFTSALKKAVRERPEVYLLEPRHLLPHRRKAAGAG